MSDLAEWLSGTGVCSARDNRRIRANSKKRLEKGPDSSVWLNMQIKRQLAITRLVPAGKGDRSFNK